MTTFLTKAQRQMLFVRSNKTGCTFALNPNNNQELLFAPMLADGSVETSFSGFAEVEWDAIDDDVVVEARRCHQLLLSA